MRYQLFKEHDAIQPHRITLFKFLILHDVDRKSGSHFFASCLRAFSDQVESENALKEAAVGDEPVASSVILEFNTDFTVYKSEKGHEAYHAPYVVIPDLARDLHYSTGFSQREDYVDLLPGPAWKLTSCRN